ncbi:MAG: hypothetical protein RR758_09240 [Burkholderiaceae bacterium]
MFLIVGGAFRPAITTEPSAVATPQKSLDDAYGQIHNEFVRRNIAP